MRSVDFAKYEGLGNDFIVVSGPSASTMTPGQARALCDRRRGVGADGVLLLGPASSPGADVKLRIINADGSVPEMCGNGVRCVAIHVARARGTRPRRLVVETDAGPRACDVDLEAGQVEVDMGASQVGGAVVVAAGGREWSLTPVNVGNPHGVTFDAATADDIARVGLSLATSTTFPEGANIEFVRPLGPAGFDVTVWERGVGLTQACGTGACAVTAVAAARGLAPYDTPVEVRLPGGSLFITVRRDGSTRMRGPARLVFTGTAPLEDER
jgi:diaminopimelate epimerase